MSAFSSSLRSRTASSGVSTSHFLPPCTNRIAKRAAPLFLKTIYKCRKASSSTKLGCCCVFFIGNDLLIGLAFAGWVVEVEYEVVGNGCAADLRLDTFPTARGGQTSR